MTLKEIFKISKLTLYLTIIIFILVDIVLPIIDWYTISEFNPEPVTVPSKYGVWRQPLFGYVIAAYYLEKSQIKKIPSDPLRVTGNIISIILINLCVLILSFLASYILTISYNIISILIKKNKK